MGLTLVLGGARSGKSAHARLAAEREAERRGGRLILIATAQALDEEMAQRIARHRDERGSAWTTMEEPLDLVGAITRLAREDVAVVDCLTLWLSNLLHAERDPEAETTRLIAAMAGRNLILVSNEVGLGIVPDNALARRFRDAQGRLNQCVAAICDQAVFVAAGLPLILKGKIDEVTSG